jgi:L-malate glycosyltransferase
MDNTNAQRPGWLFVLPWSLQEIGGVNQVVDNLFRCFRRAGDFTPCVLVTNGDTSTGQMATPEALDQFSLDLWSPVDDRHPVRALFSFLFRFPARYKALRCILIRQNVRIINPHFPGLNAIMFVMLKKFSCFDGQIILSFHGSDVKAAASTAGVERFLWKILLGNVDQILTVSKSLGSELLALEPRIANKLTTVYNGVDLELFTAPNLDRRIPEKSDKTETIISIGSFSDVKGHDVLVRAFSMVVEKMPHIQLLLVGAEGPALKKIRDLIDTVQLADRILIKTGISHERIPSLLAGARLFVLASRREGFPIVLVEAAAAKVPIVCTRAGGMPEMITDEVTGRVVDIENPTALADAILDLLHNPVRAQHFAANCFEYVRKNLTWQQTYRNYLRLSRQV